MIKFIVFCTKLIIVTIVALLFSSCRNEIEGNGDIIKEKRKITENFTKIEVSHGLEVLVEQSNDISVEVEADSNLQQYITTSVRNGILFISTNESISTNTNVVIVKLPVIEGLETNGGSELKTSNTIKGTAINLKSSSGSELTTNLEYENIVLETTSGSTSKLAGKALKFTAHSSSGSEIDAKSLEANDVVAESTSGSSCEVTAQVSLKAKASSGSSVDYSGIVKTVTKEETSGGSVSKV